MRTTRNPCPIFAPLCLLTNEQLYISALGGSERESPDVHPHLRCGIDVFCANRRAMRAVRHGPVQVYEDSIRDPLDRWNPDKNVRRAMRPDTADPASGQV